MNRDSTIVILGVLKTAYPRFYANLTKQEADNTINLWTEMFMDDDAELVTVAVKNLINSFQFPPTIADVKNKMFELTEGETKTDIELWNELRQASKSGIYYAEEIFQRLSPEVQMFLGSPASLREMAKMDSEHIETVQKGIFLKQIPTFRQRKKDKALTMLGTNDVVKKLSEKLSKNMLPGG